MWAIIKIERVYVSSKVGSANWKINIFKITCKVCRDSILKRTLTWQQLPCIPCSGNLKKYLRIEPFLPVAFWDLVCCSQCSSPSFVGVYPVGYTQHLPECSPLSQVPVCGIWWASKLVDHLAEMHAFYRESSNFQLWHTATMYVANNVPS